MAFSFLYLAFRALLGALVRSRRGLGADLQALCRLDVTCSLPEPTDPAARVTTRQPPSIGPASCKSSREHIGAWAVDSTPPEMGNV